MFLLLAAVYLGWTLGANNTANVFGPGVTSEIISYKLAIILTAGFVVLGAVIEGPKVMDTVGRFTTLSVSTASLAVLSAAITVTLMTFLKLPVSTSQAILGAIMGITIFTGGWSAVPQDKLTRILLCWLFTPFGAMIISIVLFVTLAPIINKIRSFITFALIMKVGIVVVGCYGAYTLGANNVANVTGAFVGTDLIDPLGGALIGGIAIGVGALTYSRGVMISVGRRIFPLGSFSALVAILAAAITLHVFTELRVPVSNSQAIVGAVAGIGLIRGTRAINRRMIFSILCGWIATPLVAAVLSFSLQIL